MLRYGANIVQGTHLSNANVVVASLDAESHRRTGTIPLTTVIGRRLNLLRKEHGTVDGQCLRLRSLDDAAFAATHDGVVLPTQRCRAE